MYYYYLLQRWTAPAKRAARRERWTPEQIRLQQLQPYIFRGLMAVTSHRPNNPNPAIFPVVSPSISASVNSSLLEHRHFPGIQVALTYHLITDTHNLPSFVDSASVSASVRLP